MRTVSCKNKNPDCGLEIPVSPDNVVFSKIGGPGNLSNRKDLRELAPGEGKRLSLTCEEGHTHWYWV